MKLTKKEREALQRLAGSPDGIAEHHLLVLGIERKVLYRLVHKDLARRESNRSKWSNVGVVTTYFIQPNGRESL